MLHFKLALCPIAESVQTWLLKLRGEKTNYKARPAICREMGRSFPAMHLVTQLLSGLNPKRGAAIPVDQAPAPKTRLRLLALGSVDSAVKTATTGRENYGFAGSRYKHQLELDLRYT